MASSGASFQLGEAQATGFVLIKRGRTEQVQDSEVVRVEPTVFVDLADTALLHGGGEAVLIDVTVACPVGSNGQQSYVNVSQGQASGNGFYMPVRDGQKHTLTVRAQTSPALFQPGNAQGLTFAFVEEGGDGFLRRGRQSDPDRRGLITDGRRGRMGARQPRTMR